MKIFWLPSEDAVEFDAPRHLSNARLALYWEIGPGLMVLFPALGEQSRYRAALTALPRHLERKPLFTGIADLTSQRNIGWRSYHYDFTTSLEIQQKMRAALFGI